MAGLVLKDLIRFNASMAWNLFTYKTSHNFSDVLKPGYFNLGRLRFRQDDFIRVLVKNLDEYLMVEIMLTDIKSEKITVSVISKKNLWVGEGPTKEPVRPKVVSRELDMLKPGV